MRSILNKLTPQKFQTLMQQILDLEINTEERLKGTIDLIFEKVSTVLVGKRVQIPLLIPSLFYIFQ